MISKLLVALSLLSGTLRAQAWFKVAAESTSNSATIPAGTSYRFGTGSGTANTKVNCATADCWNGATVTAATTFSPVYYTSFPFADPAPGLTKELDVLETSSAQSVTVNGKAVAVPATKVSTIPYTVICQASLPAAGPPPATVALTGCTMTQTK